MSASSQPTCVVVHSNEAYKGKQGHTFLAGVSAQSAGSEALCLHLLTIEAGGRGHAHLHEHHESAVYVISGQVEMWYGENFQQYATVEAGDFVYIPAGVPHLPANRSTTDPCIAVIARTDPNEQESVVLLPEWDNVDLPRQA